MSTQRDSCQPYRVDIYGPSLWDSHFGDNGDWISASNDYLPAISASDPLGMGGGWSDQGSVGEALRVSLFSKEKHHSFSLLLAAIGVGMGINQSHQLVEWRIAILIPEGYLLFIEGTEILFTGGNNGIMLRGVGLDDDPPPPPASPRSAGYLREQLEGTFPGAKIGEIETKISIDDSYHGDQWDIESFGYHLGAD